MMLCMTINNGYSAFGTEKKTRIIKHVPCEASGAAAANLTASRDQIEVGGSESHEVVYAHYSYETYTCPGWAWGCWDWGVPDEFVGVVRACP